MILRFQNVSVAGKWRIIHYPPDIDHAVEDTGKWLVKAGPDLGRNAIGAGIHVQCRIEQPAKCCHFDGIFERRRH